jgi:phage N-6-adenine-methyltransferase
VTLIGYRSSNHPQQTARRGANPDVDDRATSPEVFDPLHARFNFSIDVAAAEHNAKVPLYFSIDDNGLEQSWAGHRVWCNPPYSSIAPWVEKAWAECGSAELIVMILPANRTEQAWWQEMVEPYRDRDGSALRTEFVKGRLRFIRKGAESIGPNERPPFGCVLLIWEKT